MNEVQHVLKILSKAIVRETAAFNYYYKQSENESIPLEVKGLLSRLAEEERTHRRLLMNEYISIEKGWDEHWSEETGPVLTYPIPEEPPLRNIEVSPCLEMMAISLPAVLVGGDNIVTSVIKDKSKNITGTFLTLYDVMGHGLQTTDINAFANRIIGEYIDSAGCFTLDSDALFPRNVVKQLNRAMSERFEGQGVFLTMLCALFHMANSELSYTVAGHEPPFVIRKDGSIESLLNTQLVVGIDPEFPYRQTTIEFNRGDVFCVFSDGIIEARNVEGDMFGRERVADILRKSVGTPPGEMINRLMADLRDFAGGTPLNDEISIVLVSAREEL
ncbi:MAG: SpoIIE family protein phosphatase [Bacteroidales bacterium]|nr:SpoIIE family protein phosphatase [Candidatus Latescibacterota bacterium]